MLEHLAPAQLSDTARYGVELILEEVLMNIIWHAYGDEPGHAMVVETQCEGDTVVLAFEDQGVAFDPTAAADPPLPTKLQDAKIGGLGVMLVRRFARRVTYERRGDTNRLRVEIAAR